MIYRARAEQDSLQNIFNKYKTNQFNNFLWLFLLGYLPFLALWWQLAAREQKGEGREEWGGNCGHKNKSKSIDCKITISRNDSISSSAARSTSVATYRSKFGVQSSFRIVVFFPVVCVWVYRVSYALLTTNMCSWKVAQNGHFCTLL